jgi:serine/threonine-protein kinase
MRRKWLPADLVAHIQEGLDKLSAEPSSGSRVITSASGPSIAVLPFTDLSASKDQDWFCDGIAEEILNALSPLPGLRVAARASTFALRGQSNDLRAIGQKLNVRNVLEGSVRRAGDRVRITAQLSDVEHASQLWSERFDRELKDIFDVQDEIARAIVERLKVTLSIDAHERLVTKATNNLDAYELLLRGRILLTQRGHAIFDAKSCFEEAIALDPRLTEAHALLADALRLMGLYGLIPEREIMPQARAAAERALEIDPRQVEALATLANIAAVYDWDIAAALEISDRALAINPTHVRALAERVIVLTISDIPGPALQKLVVGSVGRARELDPLNAWVAAVEAFCQAFIGHLPEALAAAERSVALDENNFTGRWTQTFTLAAAGRNADAELAAAPALAMSGRHPRILAELAAMHAATGATDKAEAIHQELSERARTGHVGFAARAAVAASAGHFDEARELVAQAIAARDSYLTFWKLPAWAPFWTDAGCAALLRNTTLFS